jgi:hypothetical protein
MFNEHMHISIDIDMTRRNGSLGFMQMFLLELYFVDKCHMMNTSECLVNVHKSKTTAQEENEAEGKNKTNNTDDDDNVRYP